MYFPNYILKSNGYDGEIIHTDFEVSQAKPVFYNYIITWYHKIMALNIYILLKTI